jgi:hypothetical protein
MAGAPFAFNTWTEVILPDGRIFSARRQMIAADLGYTDLNQMCRQHDPFHVAPCDLLGLPLSFAMREAAGEKLTPEGRWAAVLKRQQCWRP